MFWMQNWIFCPYKFKTFFGHCNCAHRDPQYQLSSSGALNITSWPTHLWHCATYRNLSEPMTWLYQTQVRNLFFKKKTKNILMFTEPFKYMFYILWGPKVWEYNHPSICLSIHTSIHSFVNLSIHSSIHLLFLIICSHFVFWFHLYFRRLFVLVASLW